MSANADISQHISLSVAPHVVAGAIFFRWNLYILEYEKECNY